MVGGSARTTGAAPPAPSRAPARSGFGPTPARTAPTSARTTAASTLHPPRAGRTGTGLGTWRRPFSFSPSSPPSAGRRDLHHAVRQTSHARRQARGRLLPPQLDLELLLVRLPAYAAVL